MVVAGGAGDLGGLARELVGLVLKIEFREDEFVGTEGVGLDGIAAGAEERLMDLLDDIWAGLDEDVCAVLAVAVVRHEIEIVLVDGGAHRAVEGEDASGEFVCKAARHGAVTPLLGVGNDSGSGRGTQAANAAGVILPYFRIYG